MPEFSEVLEIEEEDGVINARFDDFEMEKYTPPDNTRSFRVGSGALIRGKSSSADLFGPDRATLRIDMWSWHPRIPGVAVRTSRD